MLTEGDWNLNLPADNDWPNYLLKGTATVGEIDLLSREIKELDCLTFDLHFKMPIDFGFTFKVNIQIRDKEHCLLFIINMFPPAIVVVGSGLIGLPMAGLATR